jgi:peptidyl-prolyl cis-trans isomerase D
VVLRLDSVTMPDRDTDEARQIRESFAEQNAQGLAQDMATAFTRAVETEAGIRLDQGAINAVHAQFP